MSVWLRVQRGFALPIVIWLLVLVTLSVVTMLFLIGRDRAASLDYGEQIRAQEFARTGVETFLLDARHEMRAGSTVLASGGAEVWFPRSAASMRLKTMANASAAPNHLRSSVSFDPTAIFPAPDYAPASDLPPSRASASVTTSYSQNGRRVSPAFWDQARLAAANALDGRPPAWIHIQRSGVSASGLTWDDTLKDRSLGNEAYVLGRYSYQVYDTGGLLDINVAGYPATLSAADRQSLEGTLAAVDLTQLGGGLNATNNANLIAFRNAATAASYTNFVTNFLSATNGNMTTVPGDNRFLSRGDLIRFAQKEGFSGALEFLTHFSRDRNAPSWSPLADATNGYAYQTQANGAASANRFLAGVQSAGETVNYYTIEGTAASMTLTSGESKIWRRFPLARIAWLRQVENGTASAGVIVAVQTHFGLNWNSVSRRWIYNPDGSVTSAASTVLTLNNIPPGRDPNFFELLKAGILAGSLGVAGTRNELMQTYSYAMASQSTGTLLQDPNADYQIMRIGANVIDQFDSDASPTVINFDYAPSMPEAWKSSYRIPAIGIENLPYIYEMSQYATVSANGAAPNFRTDAWMQFKLWNPHQQKTGIPTPPSLRISSGSGYDTTAKIRGTFTFWDLSTQTDTSQHWTTGLTASGADTFDISSGTYLTPQYFLTANSSAKTGAGADFTVGVSARRGFSLGSATYTAPPPDSFNQYVPDGVTYGVSSTNTVPLQIQTLNGTVWNPAQIIPYVASAGQRQNLKIGSTVSPIDLTATSFPASRETSTYDVFDPRTTRWGFDTMLATPSANTYLTTFTRTIATDRDGVTRFDDTGATKPYSATGATERPILLDRTFRTPADLGYAFRDQPWKTLNFRDANSADSGLLDIFSTHDDPEVVAGRINLNSARKEVIQLLLQQSTKNEATGTTFTNSQAQDIADAYATWIAANPMRSRAELSTFVASSSFTGDRKFEREGVIRALSAVGQTRTINLLLDLVAQSGFFPSSAAKLENFHVTGQYHVWAHLAIDRYTGKLIDFQWEPVYEQN